MFQIKWLLRDEIASAMLHMYPLTEQTLEMVAAHVESSRQARNCICESISLNFVCGMEQSRDKFMQVCSYCISHVISSSHLHPLPKSAF